ncbi:MAG: hypothetical protein FWG83_01745 [Oscillospiraceae bacterium]|nr:hypothetical protein [Oscillospiraceae bacterium]
MLKCTSCGHDNEPGTKFCAGCGTPVTAAVPTAAPIAPPPMATPVAPPAVPIANPVAPSAFPDPTAAPMATPMAAPIAPPPMATPMATPMAAPVAPPPMATPMAAPIAPPPMANPAAPIAPPPMAAPMVNPGAPMVSAEAPKKTSLNFKKLLKVVIPLGLLAAAAAVAITIIGSISPYAKMKDLAIAPGDDSTIIIYNNGKTAEVKLPYQADQTSMDGTKGAFLADYDYSEGIGTLFYVSGSGNPVRVHDEVHDFILADSGKGLIYWTDYDSSLGVANLNLFDGTNSSVITSDAYFNDYASNSYTTISPDGKTVFYLEDVDGYYNRYGGGDFESRAFISTGGKRGESFKSNVIPVAISNGGSYIYYIEVRDTENRLVVQKGTGASDAQRLCTSGGEGGYFLNSDYSQIVYNTTNSSGSSIARISVKGGEPSQVANSAINTFIVPDGAQEASSYSAISGTIYGFKDFKNKVFLTGGWGSGELYLLDSKLERKRFSQSASEIKMSSDGKQLFYVNDRNALCVANASNPEADVVTLARNVKNYAIGKGGHIYYVNAYDELFRKKTTDSEGEGTRVAEDVHSRSLSASGKGTVFFMTDYSSSSGDGTLNFATGATRNRVADGVSMVYATNSNAYYFVETEDGFMDIYRSPGNGKFTRIAEVGGFR